MVKLKVDKENVPQVISLIKQSNPQSLQCPTVNRGRRAVFTLAIKLKGGPFVLKIICISKQETEWGIQLKGFGIVRKLELHQ